MDDKKAKRQGMLTLALGIALLPPIWAVLSPAIGITTGAVALICAAVYVANGNKIQDAIKIAVGFICGDLWAVAAIFIMEQLPWNPSLELFVTLFVMGGLAVIIGETCHKFIYTPSWLCGWAIGLTIMGALPVAELGTLPVQIGAAMLAGVFYVGVCVDAFQKLLLKLLNKKR